VSLWAARLELVDEELWKAMVLWLPPERVDVRGGPPRFSNRAALAGILFVLRPERAAPTREDTYR